MPSTSSPTGEDTAGAFDAENLRVRKLGPDHALSRTDVHEVDTREGDLNQCFAWTGHWVGALDILQHFAATRAVHDNSPH